MSPRSDEARQLIDTMDTVRQALDLAERPQGRAAARALADQVSTRYRQEPDNVVARAAALAADAIALAASKPSQVHREAVDITLRALGIVVRARLEILMFEKNTRSESCS